MQWQRCLINSCYIPIQWSLQITRLQVYVRKKQKLRKLWKGDKKVFMLTAETCIFYSFFARCIDYSSSQETPRICGFCKPAQPSPPQVSQERLPIHLHGCWYVVVYKETERERGGVEFLFLPMSGWADWHSFSFKVNLDLESLRSSTLCSTHSSIRPKKTWNWLTKCLRL